MKRTTMLKLLVAATLPLACGSAFAATATANLAVSASVSKNCTISTTPLAFGAYDPVVANLTAALTGQGSVSVACSKGSTGLTVGLGNGLNFLVSRRMTGPAADFLLYDLFQPTGVTPATACPGTVPWGTGAAVLTLTAAPSKAARPYLVCGSIPGGQDVAVDAYADTVVATVTF